ncbi:hypothetical protein ACFVKB_26905 [Rhodococcus sp. NPDC127530]
MTNNDRGVAVRDHLREGNDTEHQGVTLEMTGLWPPYSFAGIDQATP